jgi:hypothetical protein
VGEILAALLNLMGSLADTDSSTRRRPVVIVGWLLVMLLAVGLLALVIFGR